MSAEFIKANEKRKILEKLKYQFGISKLPYLFIQSGKEKIRAFSGHLSKEEIIDLGKTIKIENLGLYIIKEENRDLRLSLDATHLFKEQITKSIIEINDSQLSEWLKGNDLNIKAQSGIVIIKHNSDFLGCGKSSGEKIFNYIPKERRLKKF